jgi:prepilin-type N-terminal cleavage/methylation domain-containing protein
MAFTEDIRCNHNLRGRFCSSGFSLVELLSVIAIIAIMMTLVAPVISGFGGAGARKGAVATVMGTLEQARVAALESGRDVVVVFARPNFPERDALIVLRKKDDGSGEYEALTRWIRLPKGILIHEPNRGENIITAASGFSADEQNNIRKETPGDDPSDLAFVKFNSSGAVAFPQGNPNQLKVVISEGIRGAGGNEALISQKKQDAGGFEIISLSRFTGRVQLDISSIDS